MMSAPNVLEPGSGIRFVPPPRLPPVDFAKEKALADAEHLVLIDSDGIPMDSHWHRHCMNLLIEQIEYHCRERDDYYVGGDMFIYFSVTQAKNLDYRGPDFFYVSKTTRHPMRKYWVVWEEKRTPDVVIELASSSTRAEDYGPKFAIYRDRLQVGNYFIYDPETRQFDGWQLQGRDYVAIPRQPNGRLWSDRLQLHLGEWDGEFLGRRMVWLRWYSADGTVVPIFSEAERRFAEAERQRADAERQRADAERQRAQAAEAEAARLKELLAKIQSGTSTGTPNGPATK
jgi:Uma2 family endonuclease